MEKDILKKKALRALKENKNTHEDEERRLNFNEDSDVFTKEVKPMSTFEYLGDVCKNFCIKIVSFIWSWIKTIVLAFVNIFVSIYKIARYGTLAIGRFFKNLGHKFKYNDKWGRLSFFIFGAGSFGHKQIVNGILYLGFQIGYILFMVFAGAKALTGIWNLGVIKVDPSWVYTDNSANFKYLVDNSLLLLITGLFVLLSIFVFIYIWLRSINAGYNNYRIAKFNEYKDVHEKTIPMSNKIDEYIEAKYKDFYNQKSNALIEILNDENASFSKAYNLYFNNKYSLNKGTVKKELANLKAEYLEKADNKFEKDYINYVFNESISESIYYYKTYYLTLNKQEKQLYLYNKVVASHEEEMNAIASDSTKTQEEIETIINRKNLVNKKIEHKYEDKANYFAKTNSNKAKTHSPFASKLSRINYNTYAKFNNYFNVLSKYNVDIRFYKAYREINEYYHNIGGDYINENQSNSEKKVLVANELNEKVEAINNRFNQIYEKKTAILGNIDAIKKDLQLEIKRLKNEGIAKNFDENNEYAEHVKAHLEELTYVCEVVQKEVSLEGLNLVEIARVLYQERINKLDGQYNSFANDKLLKSLQKEEIKLTVKRCKDDIKYLKTNFDQNTYAAQQTIDHMLVDYDFDYKYAKDSIEIINKDLTEEQVNEIINKLENEKDSYQESHKKTKFVGKSKTFVDQIKSLFNDKFHITILALPVLGAVIFSIIPLLFSILIAFTNYDKQHLIGVTPFQWTGFETFIKMFEGTDPIYGAIGEAIGATFLWTFVWAIFATFTNYFLGIVVALMINKDGIKLKKLWRTLFVLTIAVPQFISLATVAKMLQTGGMGVLNNIYQSATGVSLGFAESIKNNALVTKIIIIIVNIWVGIPYTILSTTGILMNIPKDLYESSRIDGAGPATQFFKITMPYILFVTGPSLITNFIDNFNNFGVIYFLTGGAPKRVGSSAMAPGYTDLFITYIYTLVTGNTYQYYNVASALGIIIFIVCSFISIIMYNKTGAVSKEDQFQ